jgi:hypothetical protein
MYTIIVPTKNCAWSQSIVKRRNRKFFISPRVDQNIRGFTSLKKYINY